jgi:aquaporin Z
MPGVAEYLSEFFGTMLIMIVGLSTVVFNFAPDSPVQHWVESPDLRRLITGVIFGGAFTAAIYSPLGRRSGGHFNPAMTFAFHRLHKIGTPGALAYAAAQLSGAAVGAIVVRLAWGTWATSVQVGATLPGNGGTEASVAVEIVVTFLLGTMIFNCIDRPAWMPYTAALVGVYIAFFVPIAGPISGLSLNPARSFGPALAAGTWTDFWVYVAAPTAGALLAAWLFTRTRRRIACAKLFHTDEYHCPFYDCQYVAPQHRRHRSGAAGPAQPV